MQSFDKKKPLELVVAKNAGFGFAGTAANVFLRAAIGFVTTKFIGIQSFGIYVLAYEILNVTGTIGLLGTENTVVKFVSKYLVLKDEQRVRGVVVLCAGIVMLFSIVLSFLVSWSAPYIVEDLLHKPEILPPLQIMVLSLPFTCFYRLLFAALQGARLVKYQVLSQQFHIPFLRLLFISGAVALGYKLNGVAYAYLLSEFCGVIIGSYFFFKKIPGFSRITPFTIETKKVLSVSFTLLWASLFNFIINRSEIFIIGYFFPVEIVGVYGIAQRLAPLIIVPLGAFNNIFAPIISSLFAQQRVQELKKQFRIVAKWIFMSSLPLYALLIFFSKDILTAYGAGSEQGSQVMRILCTSQMICAATGSVGFMLMMTGKHWANTVNSGFLCILSIAFNLFLIPRFGILGAAFANLISNSAVQFLRLIEVWYFLRVHPYNWNFMKSVFSCGVSILLIYLLARTGIAAHDMVALPTLSLVFIFCYGLLLWSLKLSPEDHSVIDSLKAKLMKLQ